MTVKESQNITAHKIVKKTHSVQDIKYQLLHKTNKKVGILITRKRMAQLIDETNVQNNKKLNRERKSSKKILKILKTRMREERVQVIKWIMYSVKNFKNH